MIRRQVVQTLIGAGLIVIVVTFPGREPRAQVHCTAAGKILPSCQMTLNATLGGAIVLDIVGDPNPPVQTNLTGTVVDFNNVAYGCVTMPATGGCAAVPAGDTRIFGSFSATLTYSGCGANSGVLNIAATNDTWPGNVRFAASAPPVPAWTAAGDGLPITKGAASVNVHSGMTNTVAYPYQIALGFSNAMVGGPYTQTITYDASCL